MNQRTPSARSPRPAERAALGPARLRLAAGLVAAALASWAPPLAALEGVRPQAPPPDEAAEPAEAAPELQDALRGYFLRALADELELDAARAQALQPKVEALLDALREGARGRVTAGVGVMRAARADLAATGPEKQAAADAVAAAARQERESLARTAAAREAVLASLSLREQARFLAFEGRFQERVRQLLAERQGGRPGAPGEPREPGEPGPPGNAGPGGEDAETFPPVPPPEGVQPRPGMPPRGGRPGPPPGGGPGGPPDGREDRRGGAEMKEAQRTVLLLFTHEVRTRLELSDEQTLSLLPKIESLFDTRLAAERERRDLHRRLLATADDAAATDAELKPLVERARRLEEDGPARVAGARAVVTASLSPVQAARFLLLEHRAERELRDLVRRVRDSRRGGPQGMGPGGEGGMGPGDGARPGGRGGQGPRRPGAWREGERPFAPRR